MSDFVWAKVVWATVVWATVVWATEVKAVKGSAVVQVFFVRDGIKFPDLIRCLRPNPKNHLQEGWRILDFLSHHPESIFIVSSLLAMC